MTSEAELRAAVHLSGLAKAWWRDWQDELAAAVDESIPVDRASSLFFVMSVIAHSWRLANVGESAERILEHFERYIIAHFVAAFSFPPGTADVTVRTSFMGAYRRVSPTYYQQIDKILEKWTSEGMRLLWLWALHLTTVLFWKPLPIGADKERARRVVAAVSEMWLKALREVRMIDLTSTTRPVELLWNLTIDPLDGWLAGAEAGDEFDDPARPEYRILITVVAPLDDYGGSAPEVVATDLIDGLGKLSGKCVPLGSDRAVAYYRTSEEERGVPKDDRHWWLLERDGTCLRRALFTLSVLAARADPAATDELDAQWGERICRARFVIRH